MKEFFIGRRVELLTEEQEKEIKIWHMSLEGAEIGHMACRRTEAMTFLYVYRGQLECQVERENAALEAGEACFINSDRFYRFIKGTPQGCEICLAEVSEAYLAGGFTDALKGKYITSVKDSDNISLMKFVPTPRGDSDEDILIQALQASAEIVRVRDAAYELDLKGWMLTAWGRLYKKYIHFSPVQSKAAIRERERLVRMLDYLNRHYTEKLTLTMLAEDCGVSGGEYCRFFKRQMNLTPFEYLQKCRIEHSMHELLEKSGSMSDIAAHCGFGGASYYAETFKKEMGCAPGDYRKWYRGDREDCPVKAPGEASGDRERKVQIRKEIPPHLL
ncbi:MAG: AraC family transcriptional regulator [Blautia sp.]|nr:AraC family transcriptional regulator [Blautia sp.]MDD7728779.1 AraC family transcriptional regulator [Clostridia bacterium]MDY5663242.1 AraC family transcriptional regulator [Blautia sp.]